MGSLSPLFSTLELRKIAMKVQTDLTIPEIDEIRKEGVKALVERLGIAKAAFFLRETSSQPLNYLEIKDQLFGEMTAKDIYDQIKGGYH
jgi:hypothetical protein